MLSYFPQRVFLAACVFTAMVSSPVQAGSFNAIYTFGDSLSDAGNAYLLSGGALPGAPYSNGRFSNGNVWVQDMATALGLPAAGIASGAGGTDYAIGGATSGSGALNLGGELAAYQAANPVGNPNGLYTIWIGSNDLDAILASGVTPATAEAEALGVVTNIDNAIDALKASGAKNFLVLTVPDLGKTPAAIATGAAGVAASSALSAFFDQSLVNSLPLVDAGVNLNVVNTYSIIDGIVANPGAYGFTNVTSPCLTGEVNYSGGTPCANPNDYLFWDQLHPTAAGQALVADVALQTVPEPAALTMIFGGFGLLGALAVRKRRNDLVN